MNHVLLILAVFGNLLGGIAIATDMVSHDSAHGSHLPGDDLMTEHDEAAAEHSDHCGHGSSHLLGCTSDAAPLSLGPISPQFPTLSATFSSANHRPAIPPDI